MRILIAEDDITSRMILAALLKKDGHEVVETVNGREALDELQQPGAPRLAILDWMMPIMDGLEVVRQIRASQTALPPYLIMLTTKVEKENIITALQIGADDYMAKPFDAGELKARVTVGLRIIEIQEQLNFQIQELNKAYAHIKTLEGILPICSFCKKIRDDQGSWSQMESYISDRSKAQFSHSVCPECMQEHYPNYCR
jgi:DNA-binding response OmpR family regulator